MLYGDWLFWALWFPLIGFLWCVAFGRTWPRLSGWIASLMIGLAFVSAVLVFIGLNSLAPDDRIRVADVYTWIAAGNVAIPFSLYLDPLASIMLLIVTGVSFLIHVYANGYMRGDPGFGRFFAYMNLFVLSMLVLVLAGNFVLLMVGWAGVGLCSYLLISFWFARPDKPEAGPAGVKAFVVNAIGDAGLILAASLILRTFKTVDYVNVFTALKQPNPDLGAISAITLLLLVAAVAKSAQLPLYVWLPDAMAGPTPVSALIHAATMVTAGVYLIARASPLFQLAPTTMAIIAWIGALTALFAATIGLVKPNIKRVLAYSTVSQLGYMFLAVGLSGFAAGIFHLMTHAFFKALLFLAAGAVIHAVHDDEELAHYGGLREKLPLTYYTFLIGALAIAGFPLLSGFFSKDEIITLAFGAPTGNVLLGLIALVTAGLTAVYVFRVVFLTFHGKPRMSAEVYEHAHDPPPSMAIPLLVLAALAAIGGYVQWPGEGFANYLEPGFSQFNVTVIGAGGLNVISLLAALVAVGGIYLAWLIWGRGTQTAENLGKQFSGAYRVLLNDYGIDALYSATIVAGARGLGQLASGVVDRQVIDAIVNGVPNVVGGASVWVARLESGYVRTYAIAILTGAILIVAFMARGGL
jgi:NADH-quinone oxidoreductase subunit L